MDEVLQEAETGHLRPTRRKPAQAIEDIVGAVRAGRTSVQAVVRNAVVRIERDDRTICAWVRLNPLAHRKAANTSSSRGRLAGVPFGVKDLIDVAGLPTAFGLAESEYHPSAAIRSAIAVQRFDADGAIPLGKTVTSALALERPGPTRNPLDLARSPGASSSGSAAAVAAGMVPLALGTQAIGSVIRPASYCGVWAFVPSHGAVPSDGSFILSETLDRIGVLASSPQGLVLAGQTLIGASDSEANASAAGRDARIGVMASKDLASRAPEATLHLASLASPRPRLALPMRTQIDFSAVLEMTRTIAAFELHQNLARKQLPLASLSRALVAWLAAPRPAEEAYRDALAFRDRLADAWDRLTAGFDAVVLPSAVAEAPVGLLDDQDPAPASLGSLLGLPAVNIPLFTSANGLPLGCQMLGRKRADLAVLQLAVQFAADVREEWKPS